MKQRVLAIAGAVILVCAAVLAREVLVGRDEGSGGGGSKRAGAPVVACTPDLATVCDALAESGTIAEDPPVLDLGDPAPDGLDGWITWDPAPEVANFGAPSPRWAPAEPVGAAPLVVLATPEGIDAGCASNPTWDCVGQAGRSGSALGVGDPADAEGLARLAPLVAAADVDDFDALASAMGQIVDGPTRGQVPAATAARQLVTTPGALDAVVVGRPLAEAQSSTAQGTARKVRVVAPTPAATATAVLAPTVDGDPPSPEQVCDDAADALEALGLEPCAGSTVDDGLAGLLFQVHERLG